MTQDANAYPHPAAPGLPAARRPAEAVEVRLKNALAESHYHALRTIKCRVVSGEATLEGALDSYYHKQVAQAIAARVPGVVRVRNLIRVAHGQPGRALASAQHGG